MLFVFARVSLYMSALSGRGVRVSYTMKSYEDGHEHEKDQRINAFHVRLVSAQFCTVDKYLSTLGKFEAK